MMKDGFINSLKRWINSVLTRRPHKHFTDEISVLDYEQMISLDAEDLAELGIKKAYDAMQPTLQQYVTTITPVSEMIDEETGRYSVVANGVQYDVYPPSGDEDNSWGLAACALFDIVNRQLVNSDYKFYAINGGNDLGGMFLTQEQYRAAIRSLPG